MQMNESQVNPQAAPTIPGIPMPAGTDENGNPFWIIDDRKIFWADMQRYIAQLQAQKQVSTEGKGPEAMAQMVMPNVEIQPAIPKAPEFTPRFETKAESGAERGIETFNEQSTGIEAQPNNNAVAQPVVTSTAPTAPKKSSLLGDSPALTQVDTTNPASMVAYAETHQKDAAENSSRFLSVLVEKIVKIFSLEH